MKRPCEEKVIIEQLVIIEISENDGPAIKGVYSFGFNHPLHIQAEKNLFLFVNNDINSFFIYYQYVKYNSK
jgi:hypothetical protein